MLTSGCFWKAHFRPGIINHKRTQMKIPLILVIFTLYFAYTNPATAAYPKQAIVTGDEIKVRDQPSRKGKYVNILYQNMVVTALAESNQPTEIDGFKNYWYQIEAKDFTGWVYGKYLSFNIPVSPVDTYDTEGDISWFYERFGHSTHSYATEITVESFNTEEYRKLIKAFSQGKETDSFKSYFTNSYYTGFALYFSILHHLNKSPDDPKYQYLRHKIESNDFIRSVVKGGNIVVPYSYIYEPLVNEKEFLLELLTINERAIILAADKFMDDKEVILQAVRAGGHNLKFASDRLKDDREVVFAAIDAGSSTGTPAVRFSSLRLRDDKGVILTAVKRAGNAVQFASDRLKNDRDIAVTAVSSRNYSGYPYLSYQMKTDKGLMHTALQRDGKMLEFAIDPDRETVLNAVKTAHIPTGVMRFIPYKFTSDQEILDAGFNNGTNPANPERFTEFGKVALVNDDEVRVRKKPGSKGNYVGVLYKNMIVDVLEESDQRQIINGDSHHWYRIKAEDFSGWIYGKFLSFYVPYKNVDTYLNQDNSPEYGVYWFEEHFMDNASTDTANFTVESFSLNQYRTFIRKLKYNLYGKDKARELLLDTIYEHLKKHPDDPKYAYLKKKFYSAEFLKKMFPTGSIPGHLTLDKTK